MRESILKGVPKPVWRAAYEAVLKVIAGDVMTLAVNREKAVRAFAVYGVKPDQVFAAIGVLGEADITLEHITVMRGMFSALKNGEETVESMFTKREKETDKDYNPLVRGEKTDATTGEVTKSDSISTGGAHEVAKDQGKGPAEASSSANEIESAEAAQHVGQTDESSVNQSTDKASATPAPADAGTSAAVGGSSSQQPDLLSGTDAPAGGKGAAVPGPADGADGGSRGGTPSAPERLKSYHRALSGIETGAPKLAKQSMAWMEKHGTFADGEETKRSKIYALHVQRVTGEINMDGCKAKVEEIISK
jgi:hypothetical protein